MFQFPRLPAPEPIEVDASASAPARSVTPAGDRSFHALLLETARDTSVKGGFETASSGAEGGTEHPLGPSGDDLAPEKGDASKKAKSDDESDEASDESETENEEAKKVSHRRLATGVLSADLLAAPMTIQSLNNVLLGGGVNVRAEEKLSKGAGEQSAGNASKTKPTRAAVTGRGDAPRADEPTSEAPVDRTATDGCGSAASGSGERTGRRESDASANPTGGEQGESKSPGEQRARDSRATPTATAGETSRARPAVEAMSTALRKMTALTEGSGGGQPTARIAGGAAVRGDASAVVKGATVGTAPVRLAATAVERRPAGVSEAVTLQMLKSVAAGARRAGAGGADGAQTDSAVLTLRPASLGAMKVRVDVRDGVVSAMFESSNEAAHGLLKASVADLREQLESRGMMVDRLDVHMRPEKVDPATTGSVESANRGTDAERTAAHGSTGAEEAPVSDEGDSSGKGEWGRGGGERGGHRGGASDEAPADEVEGHGVWTNVDGLIDAIA